MIQLNEKGLRDRAAWESAGYHLPHYNRQEMRERTQKAPFWIHFGAGNIFRAFQANVVQKLINDGFLDRGLIVAEGYDYEIIEKMNRPCDDYSILVTLKADGSVEKTVVGSVAESLILSSRDEGEFSRLKEIFRSNSLQMASFTITEKGYSLVNGRGELLPEVQEDFEEGPGAPRSYIGKVTALLYERFLDGQKPLAMVSMDNCSHNGDRLHAAVAAFAQAWCGRGVVRQEFETYVNDKGKVSFPWTMIDKITPRPDPTVEAILEQDGLAQASPVVTAKHTYVAPFVNAEETQYLVIEDSFPNGREPLEKGGFIFTDRQTVDKVEKMKVCTCLNPLHTALAVYGCLLGYERISEEMKDPVLRRLAERIGYEEGLPAAVHPGIIDPEKFLDEVLNVRIPNPFMPDTPQRIATDTSQKLAVRYGETIKVYMKSEALNTEDLKMIPLVFAGWLRYLTGISDEGKAFVLSPDPLLETICGYVKDMKPGEVRDAEERLHPILSDASIFGVNLYEAGLAGRTISYFEELMAGTGAVRRTLRKYVCEKVAMHGEGVV